VHGTHALLGYNFTERQILFLDGPRGAVTIVS
jgi:hypothetical protein